MEKEIELSDASLSDLKAIWKFVSEQARNERIADKVLSEIPLGFKFLSENSFAGHFREDLVKKPMRFYAVHDYLILHLVEDVVRIARVMRASQDISKNWDVD